MMPNCKMNETKLEINENYEETELSDVDDDVFVRSSGRNGFRMEYDIAKKPLMTPRKKNKHDFDNFKNGGLHTEVRSSPATLRILCMPICYILVATFSLLGLIAMIAFLSHYISIPFSSFKFWGPSSSSEDGVTSSILPCDKIQVKDVWVMQFPKLITESAIRMLDTNQDGIDDIIVGFGTGADGYNVPEFVCDIYFSGQKPCFGGVLALDGVSGSELWRHWTEHEVFAVNCNEDLNKDGIHDCLIAGRAGVFCAISGTDGSLLWSFEKGPAKNSIMNVYTPQFIRDLNEDGVVDILAIHGGDPLAEAGSKSRLSGRIILMSGKDGKPLRWVDTPDQRESYYSPQVLTRADGSDFVLFGTGGETHSGSLYVISMQDLHKGLIGNAKNIYTDDMKGIMVPPVITDINGDGSDDIIMAMFNSTVVAFDGISFKQIWNHSFPSSETYTTPTPGYFNEDPVPDFLVKYQEGPGFPIYYHAQTTILDGRTGKPLLDTPMVDSIGSQASTPLIRVQGYGNDIFLYWSSNCKGFEGNSTQFSFAKGTNIHEQTRSDFCKLRFDSKLINQLHGFSRGTGLPGNLIYDSESRVELEFNGTVNTALEGQNYLQAHSEMWQYYGQQEAAVGGGGVGGGRESVPIATAPFLTNDRFAQLPYDQQQQQQQQPGGIIPPPLFSDSVLPVGQIRSYASLGPGPNIPPYDPNAHYGIIEQRASQPERMADNIKYPEYHNVRKHGKFQIPSQPRIPQPDVNVPININRRGRLSLEDRDVAAVGGMGDAGALWRDFLAPGGNIYPGLDGGNLYQPIGDGSELGRQYYPSKYERGQPSADDMGTYSNNGRLSGNYNRRKRHIGPHDSDGIQRLISTGTLARPLNSSREREGIDLVFATYWFFPAKTQVILPKDTECIQDKMREENRRFEEGNKYAGMTHDQFETAVTKECLEGDEMSEATPDESASQDRTFESQSTYNPFDIHMGQMTIYRLHISCSCSKLPTGDKSSTQQRCGKILPFEDQPWSAYMGSHADSYFPFRAPVTKTKSNPKTNDSVPLS